MESYFIKDRLRQYLDEQGITANNLEDMCGFSKRYLANVGYKVPADKIERILAALPHLNREWLLRGVGEMTSKEEIRVHSKERFPAFKQEVLSRIKQVIEAERMTIDEYEKCRRLLIQGTYERCMKRGGVDEVWSWIKAIIREYPRYSPTWIIYGEGEMLRRSVIMAPVVKDAELFNYIRHSNSTSFVESYEYSASGNTDFSNADYFIRLTSASYSHLFEKSDIIACRKIKLKDAFPGNFSKYQHLILLSSGTIYIQYIRSIDENTAEISAANDFSSAVKIEISKIIEIAEIFGYRRLI